MDIADSLKHFEAKNVFRIIYTEHLPADTGCVKLKEVMNALKVRGKITFFSTQ